MSYKPIVALVVIAFFGAFFMSLHSALLRAHPSEILRTSVPEQEPIELVIVVSPEENETADAIRKDDCPACGRTSATPERAQHSTAIVLHADRGTLNNALGLNSGGMASPAQLALDNPCRKPFRRQAQGRTVRQFVAYLLTTYYQFLQSAEYGPLLQFVAAS